MTRLKPLAVLKALILLAITTACSSPPLKGFVSEGKPISPIRKVLLRSEAGFYPDIQEALKEELRRNAIDVSTVDEPTLDSQKISDTVDTIIWVKANKAWDLGTYIKRLELRILDPKTGALIGTGTWEARWWHGHQNAEEVVHDLLKTILSIAT